MNDKKKKSSSFQVGLGIKVSSGAEKKPGHQQLRNQKPGEEHQNVKYTTVVGKEKFQVRPPVALTSHLSELFAPVLDHP